MCYFLHKSYIQGRKVSHLSVIEKSFSSEEMMPNMKTLSLMVQNLLPRLKVDNRKTDDSTKAMRGIKNKLHYWLAKQIIELKQ